MSAKISEFTEENETLSVAKAMEKGKEQIQEENIKKIETGSKKNIWKIIIILILIIAVIKACGNGNTCKEKECHDKIYKDGYCRTHYTLHITNEYLDGYFNPDYGK